MGWEEDGGGRAQVQEGRGPGEATRGSHEAVRPTGLHSGREGPVRRDGHDSEGRSNVKQEDGFVGDSQLKQTAAERARANEEFDPVRVGVSRRRGRHPCHAGSTIVRTHPMQMTSSTGGWCLFLASSKCRTISCSNLSVRDYITFIKVLKL